MIKRRKTLVSLVVMLFYAAGIAAAMEAVLTARTSQGAIAWSVSLVSFPFAAVPAYLVFGRSRFAGISEAYSARQEEIDGLVSQMQQELMPWAVSGNNAQTSWENAVFRLSPFALTRGNSVELLIDGEATFDSILDGIAKAQDYILFQFYMMRDDGLGQRVKTALQERAAAGVRVYVLYDEVGSQGLPGSYITELTDAGIEVSSFRPTQGWGNRFQLNFRNHRKMVVVDGRIGWVGGLNVGDEYMGLDPKLSPWRDTHLRMEGPSVQQLQAVILGDWYWATRTLPPLNWTPEAAEDADQHAMILPTSPADTQETAGLFYVAALNGARKTIWLSSPYFVPDEAVMKALKLAALRGVDVRILTTGLSDSLPVHFAAFHYIEDLQGLGINFYAYKPGFLHAKVMLIDGKMAAVGTHNFDNRSFRLNFEVSALVVDDALSAQLEAQFEKDFAHAELIDPKTFDDNPLWWHLVVKIARLAAPVL